MRQRQATGAFLTVDGDVQFRATLVVFLSFVIVVAEGRGVPFRHSANCPHHGGASLVSVALPDRLLHIKLRAYARTLTHGAGGRQRVAVPDRQLGWCESRFVWTSCIC